jgi:hypothetical protein
VGLIFSVADPDSLNTGPDTDPDQHLKYIRIRLRLRIRIQGFDDQKLKKKNTDEIFNFLFLIKNYNLLITRPPYRTSKLQEKPSPFSSQKGTSRASKHEIH